VTTSDVTPSHRERLSTTLLQPKLSTLSGCTVETENLSVRVFPLACFLGQPKSLQSRDLFTNNLCLDFVAHRESVLPRSLLQPRLHSHVFRISGHGALSFTGAETRPHSVHTQHVCSVRNGYVCTKHDEKRPRTTSWRGRISGVGFAAKLERSNSIDRAWASLTKRSACQTWASSAARASPVRHSAPIAAPLGREECVSVRSTILRIASGRDSFSF
jgi:hypothetical protein